MFMGVEEIEDDLFVLQQEADRSHKLEPIFSLTNFKPNEAYEILNPRHFLKKLYSSYWEWLGKQAENATQYNKEFI